METYTWLRSFADSWFLIFMTVFFVGQILWTLRPGSRAKHEDLANIPLRNDEFPSADNEATLTTEAANERA